MKREEFDILMKEYGVPIEAAERFTVEESGTDWESKYNAEHEAFEAAKKTYLDIVFSKKEDQEEEQEDTEEFKEEKFIVEREREL